MKNYKKIAQILSLVLVIGLLFGCAKDEVQETSSVAQSKPESQTSEPSANTKPQFGKIKTDKLEIDMDTETPLFPFSNNWQPGSSEKGSTVLKNTGTLDLQYKFCIRNVVETDGSYYSNNPDAKPDGSRLSEVLDVWNAKTEEEMTSANYLGTLAELIDVEGFTFGKGPQILLVGQETTVDFLIKMREEAGNQYMGDSIKFDIAIIATQYNPNSDSGQNQPDTTNYDVWEPLVAKSGEYFTIENVKIDADSTNAEDAIVAQTGSTVIINSGYFDGGTTELGGAGNTAVFADGGMVTINEGYFTINGLAEGDDGHIDLIYADHGGRIDINGGTFVGTDDTVWLLNCKDNSNATITINGGTFINWNPRTITAPEGGQVEINICGNVTTLTQANGDVWYIVG